ncbi:MAG: hypothetical protein QXN71_04055 [Candidatus Aenigmatarchaeota archaeon]
MKFLLDANFLMIPGKFRVDILKEMERFGKPELYTLDLVVKELSRISTGGGKEAFSAKMGLLIIQQADIGILETEGKNTDREILKFSEKGFVVCTQDKTLISNIRKRGGRVVFLRQKKYLEMK